MEKPPEAPEPDPCTKPESTDSCSENQSHPADPQGGTGFPRAVGGLTGMIVGVRTARRMIWVAGASLMMLVVAKLFLFDLRHTGTVARVVSFLGVGVLLLIVGYFAPVPPSASARTREPKAEEN